MPIAQTRLEALQISKLMKSVRERNIEDIYRLCANGIDQLVNYNDPISGKTPLIQSIEMNDNYLFNILIQIGANAKIGDLNGKTPLMYACELGLTQLVDALCKKSDLNTIDSNSRNALSYCFSLSSKRHTRCTEIVLNYDLENNLNLEKGSALVEACKRKLDHIALLIIRNNPDVNDFDSKTKNCPLHYAAANGLLNLCYALLQNKADPNARNFKDQTPAMLAAQNGHINVVKLLYSLGANFDVLDLYKNNIMYYAVESRKASLIKYLGLRGGNPKNKNYNNVTAFSLAKKLKVKGFKKTFRKARKNYNIWKSKFECLNDNNNNEHDGSTQAPSLNDVKQTLNWTLRIHDFLLATKERSTGILETISNQGLYRDKISKDDVTNFLYKHMSNKIPKNAVESLFFTIGLNDGLISVPQLFMSKNFERVLNIKFEKIRKKKKKRSKLKIHKIKGKTKVKIPIVTKNPVYQEMLPHCNDVTRFNIDNHPLNNLLNDSKWYMKCENPTTVELSNVINSGHINAVKQIIENDNGLVNTKDKYYETPLLVSARKGDMKMLKYLLSKNANVNFHDNFKWTPLHHAVFEGNTDVVVELLKNGASINSKSISGNTPFMLAVKANNLELVKYLINKNAKVFSTENYKKETPLNLAETYAAGTEIEDLIKAIFDSKTIKQKRFMTRKYIVRGRRNLDVKKTLSKPADMRLKPVKIDKIDRNILRRPLSKAYHKRIVTDCAKVTAQSSYIYPTRDELINEKRKNRKIHGWEYDFPQYQTPYTKNINHLLNANTKQPIDPKEYVLYTNASDKLN